MNVLTRLNIFITSSLKRKLIFALASFLIPLLFLLIFISYNNFSKTIQRNYISYNSKIMKQLSWHIDVYFKQLENISLMLYTDLIFSSPYKYQNYNRIIKNLQNMSLQRDETNSILFYIPSDNELYIVNKALNRSFINVEEIENQKWYEEILNSEEQVVIQPSHRQVNYPEEYMLSTDSLVFSINRRIMINNKLYGILSLNYNTDFLKRFLVDVLNDKDDHIRLINEGFLSICSTGGRGYQHIDSSLLKIVREKSEMNGSLFFEDPVTQETYLLIYDKLDYRNLMIVQITPVKTLKRQATATMNFNLVVSLITVGLIVAIVTLISNSVTKPLLFLQDRMEKAGNGNFDVRMLTKERDEIGVISHSFNNMIDQFKKLINEKYKMKLKFREAQLMALQAQINPHFLYNTLQTIGSVALDKNCEEVELMTTALSAMFRYSIRASNDSVTLGDEVENLRNYLFIQKIRFEEKLTYDISVPEQFNYIIVPRLLLQPIVENSVIHGIEPLKDNGHVSVTCHKENGNLIIEITDNGIGITVTQLDVLKKVFDGFNDEEVLLKNNIGILNIYQRCLLKYGQSFKINIDSEINKGTSFVIFIPIKEVMKDQINYV